MSGSHDVGKGPCFFGNLMEVRSILHNFLSAQITRVKELGKAEIAITDTCSFLCHFEIDCISGTLARYLVPDNVSSIPPYSRLIGTLS